MQLKNWYKRSSLGIPEKEAEKTTNIERKITWDEMSNQRRNNSFAKRRRSPKKHIEALSGKKKGGKIITTRKWNIEKRNKTTLLPLSGPFLEKKTFQRNFMWSNKMFIILSHVTIPMFLKAAREDDTQLWHYIYGHFCFKDLNTLIKKNEMVKKLHELKEVKKTCTDWIMKKQQREDIFEKASWRTNIKLELIPQMYVGISNLNLMVERCNS